MLSGIVHLKSKTVYGFTSNKTPIYLFQPFDTSIEPFLVGCSEKDRSQNIIGLAKIIETSGRICRGALEQVLGKCGDRSAEEQGILWRYAPLRWNPRKLPFIEEPLFNNRLVLDVPTINIDPEGCTDIDDCISIWDDKIAITIADVHEWIITNPWLAEKASQIGQTTYNNGQIANRMLPSILSDEQCSLQPLKERLGMSLIFNHDLTDIHIEPTVIINKKSYSYENVKDATDFPIDTLQQIVEKIAGEEVNDPHKWVEHLMIFYNKFVASTMGYGLWRGHSQPSLEKLNKYSSFGNDLEKLAHSSALYTPIPSTHWGLGNIVYCHATSPIRRWADVVNQGSIKNRCVDYQLNQLNTSSKNAKKYERDIFFLQKLFEEASKLKDCTVLDSNEHRSRVWVPLWNRIITLNKGDFKEGEKLLIDYYLNLDAPSWKKRIVFRVEDTNSQEQQHHEQSSDVGPW
jgi:exoribonuclease R